MKRYRYTPGEEGPRLAEDEAGEWVRFSDVEAIIEARDHALSLTERFSQVTSAYQDALEASFETTRQVWRQAGRDRAIAVERAERRTRRRYRNGASA